MVRVALKGLAGRKLRAALTAIAIVLGVAMVSGTFVLTDTIDKAFSQIFQDSYANTDVVVSGAGADINFQGMQSVAPPVDAALLDAIRDVPGVEAAAGSVTDQTATKLLDQDGKAVNTNGAPSFGIGVDPSQAAFNPLKLVAGQWPQGENEVVLDAGTADDQGYGVGDTVKVATLQPVQEFEVTGLAQYGEVGSLGTATFAVFDLETAQQLLDREGQYDAISVAAADGVTPEQLQQEIQAVVGEQGTVRTGAQEADEQLETVAFTDFIRIFLLVFAGIAVFVGAFVIFNTFSITVTQRTREFATLRTIGASRLQLLGSVVLESLVIGVLASLVGLFAGLGLALGLNALFKALELDLPTAGTVFATRTIVVSMLVGTIVTLLAGLFPAIRATRVPPIAAVREGAELPKSRLAPYVPYIAIVIIAGAVALLGMAMFRDDLDTAPRLLSIAAGVLLLFMGVALVSKHVVRPLGTGMHPVAAAGLTLFLTLVYPLTIAFWLIRYGVYSKASTERRLGAFAGGWGLIALLAGLLVLLGLSVTGTVGLYLVVVLVLLQLFAILWFLRRIGRFEPEWPVEFPNIRYDRQAASIARENARRNPQRTAATAAALMIGVALVTFVAVLANGMKASNRDAIEEQISADYVVTATDGFSPFVAGAGDALAESGAAEEVSPVRSELAEIDGKGQYLTGVDPETIFSGYTFQWLEGSNDVVIGLGRDGAIVAKDFAEDNDLAVGSPITVTSTDGKEALLEVKGIYEPPPFFPLLGAASISIDTFDRLYERPRNQYVFVNGPAEAQPELEAAVADFPDAKVQTQDAWITQQDEDFNQFLSMLYVLLALSVIVSLFGMVNTLVLSVFERTRELGMLRAIGMTRRQTRRMIRHESVMTALIGAALGLPLGVFLAALVTQALSQFDVRFSVPGGQLLFFAVISIVVGILAAIAPARRAARLNVLRALQYE